MKRAEPPHTTPTDRDSCAGHDTRDTRHTRDTRASLDALLADAQDAARAAKLARAKRLAGGVLAAAVALLVLARWLQPAHPAFGYLAAFAEAAIVGALADWYAVAVLFRHPFGLRLPHTAIVPANQERIADNLGAFIETHFLAPAPIAERLARVDFAGQAGAWLADPQRNGALVDYATGLLPQVLRMLEEAGLREQLVRSTTARLEAFDVAPVAAGVLDALTHEGRHHELLDAILRGLHRLLQDEQTIAVLREKIRAELPALFNMFKADGYLLARLLRSAASLLDEVQADPQHPLRREFDAFAHRFVERLQHSDDYRARLETIKQGLLAKPQLRGFALDLWRRFEGWLEQDVASPQSSVRARTVDLLAGIGRQLQSDAALRAQLDAMVSAALQALVTRHRRRIAQFVSDQMKSWDKADLVRLVELNIGPDLQYIRINGAIVGGTIGLAIHAVTRLLGTG